MPDPEPSQSAAVRGRFLVLDGPDGGGKTTQAAALAAWLRARSVDVVTCRDPGGTELGNKLRAIVIKEGDTIDEQAFKALVRSAVAFNTSR